MTANPTTHDPATLAFYDAESEVYASRAGKHGSSPRLTGFLAHLRPGARILELGCGGGQDAQAIIAAGFELTPTDGSPALAEQAERRLGIPVRVMKFHELDALAVYDAVWANACLLHVPESGLADVLSRVHRALKSRGRFYASFKSGDGGSRDNLGRYYNFPPEPTLRAAYAAAGAWAMLEIDRQQGGGYDGVTRTWLHVMARKGA